MRDEKCQVKYSINMKTFTAEYHKTARPCNLGVFFYFSFFSFSIELLILCEVIEVQFYFILVISE